MRIRTAGLFIAAVGLVATNACTDWSAVKDNFCAKHDAGEGECLGDAGEPDAGPVGTFDGGPPVTWVVVRGGIQNDELASFDVDPAGLELAVSGDFANAIDFGNGGAVVAQAATAKFLARYRTSDGSLIDANAFRCGIAPQSRADLPLVYVDGGLVLGATCWVPPATVLDQNGAVVTLDGGLTTPGPDPFVFKTGALGTGIQYLNTPFGYEPAKGMVALARARDAGEFLVAANVPIGSEFLGMDGGADGGQTPVLARLHTSDFSPQVVDVFDCPEVPVVEFEQMVTDPAGDAVFAMIHASPNSPTALHMCEVTIGGLPTGSGTGSVRVGLNRHLFSFDSSGSHLRGTQGFGQAPLDGGVLRLISDGPDSLYFAGKALGGIIDYDFAEPTIVVGHFNLLTGKVDALHAFRGGGLSDVAINDIAVIGGVSPKIWVTGRVKGQLEDIDGGFILASNDSASADGFLIQLNPSTLSPSKQYVFGNPGVSEEGRRLVLRSSDLYVAGTVTAPAGTPPYVFGGKPAPLIGGRDVLLFKMPIPP